MVVHISNKICSVGKHLCSNLLRYYNIQSNKVIVIPNDVPKIESKSKEGKTDFSDMLPEHKNAFRIGYAGTLSARKNVHLLINVLSFLEKHPIILLIVGNGKEEKKLKTLADNLNVNFKIIWKEWTPNIFPLIKKMDLLVLPSNFEGCPNALLDAMAVGTPCIASNVPGNAELLEYAELLFPINRPNILYRKLERIIISKQYLTKISELCNKRKKYYDFDWDEKVVKLSEEVAIYHEKR